MNEINRLETRYAIARHNADAALRGFNSGYISQRVRDDSIRERSRARRAYRAALRKSEQRSA